jgi:hypothetical protein
MLRDWHEVLQGRTGRAWGSEVVLAGTGTLSASQDIAGAAAAVHEIELARPGAYLAVAVAPGREDIDLLVARISGEERQVVGKDQMEDHFPVVAFEMADPGRVEVYVVASGERYVGTGYDLRVYEAKPE